MAGTLHGVRYFGKANRQRYEALAWSRPSVEHDTVDGPITIETATLRDKRGGALYHEGAYRVSYKGKHAVFFGETAHSDAQRLVDDLYWALRHDNLRSGAGVRLY